MMRNCDDFSVDNKYISINPLFLRYYIIGYQSECKATPFRSHFVAKLESQRNVFYIYA